MNMQPALQPKPDARVAIIGSGFSGICMGIKLKDAGIEDFVIFEKADEVGGTWRENHYPGCACDVPSHLYSYSFEPKPDWSRAFSPQGEILEYLKHCADKYGIRAHIRFGTAVTRAAFDEHTGHWAITDSTGATTRAKYLVSGAGGLHVPAYPDIPGLDCFEGPMFHSADWDHEAELKGKKIAVIGTGASAIQFVPEIAPDAAHLTVFQRTAPWVMPKMDHAFPDKAKRRFASFPPLRDLLRKLIYGRLELTTWMFASHPDWIKRGEEIGLRHIKDQIDNPELRETVTPSFPLGCKRVLLSNDWYPALSRDNVDVETGGIAEVRGRSVITKNGREIEADVLILGTGFKAMELPPGLDIIGRNGKSLRKGWARAPEAFLGITCAGYPNYFMMMGPNTGLGSNSMVFMIEAQSHYTIDAIRLMEQNAIAFMDVKPEVQRAYNDQLQQKMEHTIWNTGCTSWYQTASGHNAAIWPHTTIKYWTKTRHVNEADYEKVKLPDLVPALPLAAE